MSRPLYEIASEIRRTWTKPYFGAVPYLEAMGDLQTVQDNYFYDSGKSVVLYFLANANTWRGPDAKRIKAELKALVKWDDRQVMHQQDEWQHWFDLTPGNGLDEPRLDPLEAWLFHTCLALRNKCNGFEHTQLQMARVAYHTVKANRARALFRLKP